MLYSYTFFLPTGEIVELENVLNGGSCIDQFNIPGTAVRTGSKTWFSYRPTEDNMAAAWAPVTIQDLPAMAKTWALLDP